MQEAARGREIIEMKRFIPITTLIILNSVNTWEIRERPTVVKHVDARTMR
jgi:hypothetical protein